MLLLQARGTGRDILREGWDEQEKDLHCRADCDWICTWGVGWGRGVCQTLVRFETRVCFETEDMTSQNKLGTDVK